MLGRQRVGYVPLQRTGANPYWVARGLVGLYALRRGIWDINQVNGSTGGTSVGTGVTFDGSNRLVTPGVASNGARLETGLTLAQLQASAYTLLSGHEKLSGAVCLSLMGTDSSSAGNWNGAYSYGTGQWRCASNNTFDGSANIPAAGLPLETRASGLALNATSLVAAAQRLAIVDPSLTQPVSSYFIAADTAVALGWRNAYSTASDNPSVTAFTFFACFNKVLPVADLQFLTTYPDDLFVCAPRYIGLRKLWLSGAAGGGTDYPVTRAESADASDTASLTIIYAATAAEIAEATSAHAAAMAAAASIAETGEATSTQAAVLTAFVSIAENGEATDSSSTAGLYGVTVAEASDAADVASAIRALFGTTSETGAATDTSNASLPGMYSVTVVEAANAEDAAAQAMAAAVTVAEGAVLLDSAEALRNWLVSAVETAAAIATASVGGLVGRSRYGVLVPAMNNRAVVPSMANTAIVPPSPADSIVRD